MGDARIDPSLWHMQYRAGLTGDKLVTFARLTNREVYAALLSRLYTDDSGTSAFPHSFQRVTDEHAAGCWRSLLQCDPLLGDDSLAVRTAVREVFTRSRTQALPQRARQALWQLHVAGFAIGARTGGDGLDPVSLAVDDSRVVETHTQLVLHGPVARRVWQCVLDGFVRRWPSGSAWTAGVLRGHDASRTAQRAILLGLRPGTQASEAFALLRGLTVDAIVRHRNSLSAAMRDGLREPFDALRAAADIYARVREELQAALSNDRRRCVLLQKQMRAAGLPLNSCFGPNNPLARWDTQWISTYGAVALAGDHVRQLVLPERPPAPPRTPLSRRRLAPRDDWAPPPQLPPGCHQLFIASTHDELGWGYAFIGGGDCESDLTARAVCDAACRSSGCAPLDALLAALEYAADPSAAIPATAPLILRLPSATASALAGCHVDTEHRAQCASALRAYRDARYARRGQLWLAGYAPVNVWAERALALACYGRRQGAFALPPSIAPTAPPPPWAGDDCPVCLSAYDDPWPAPGCVSRAPEGRWACPSLPHAICRDCDARVAANVHNNRCPVCRQPRR